MTTQSPTSSTTRLSSIGLVAAVYLLLATREFQPAEYFTNPTSPPLNWFFPPPTNSSWKIPPKSSIDRCCCCCCCSPLPESRDCSSSRRNPSSIFHGIRNIRTMRYYQSWRLESFLGKRIIYQGTEQSYLSLSFSPRPFGSWQAENRVVEIRNREIEISRYRVCSFSSSLVRRTKWNYAWNREKI